MNSADRPQADQPTHALLVALLRLAPRTVAELAGVAGLTPNAIRSQLAALGRDGLVRRQGVRHREAAGKPPALYAVTEYAQTQFSRAYMPALTAVAETLADRLSPDELRLFFGAAGARLAAQVDRSARGDAAARAKSLLESLGGAATVHSGHGRAVVQGVACPLAATVRICPESCELVRSLLAHATGVPVATRCDHDGTPTCRFEVG